MLEPLVVTTAMVVGVGHLHAHACSVRVTCSQPDSAEDVLMYDHCRVFAHPLVVHSLCMHSVCSQPQHTLTHFATCLSRLAMTTCCASTVMRRDPGQCLCYSRVRMYGHPPFGDNRNRPVVQCPHRYLASNNRSTSTAISICHMPLTTQRVMR